MKKILLVLIALIVSSCSKNEEKEISESIHKKDSASIVQDSIQDWVSINKDFLDKFRKISVDSTKFIAPEVEDQLGAILNKDDLKHFPKSLNWDTFAGVEKFETVGKFEFNEKFLGLLMRTPSEYSFTSVKLFFYDKNQEKILPNYFELADKWGDAGYTEEVKSWLFKSEENQLISFLHLYRDLQKIEPSDPTKPFTTNEYFRIQLSPEKFDTMRVSKNKMKDYQVFLDDD